MVTTLDGTILISIWWGKLLKDLKDTPISGGRQMWRKTWVFSKISPQLSQWTTVSCKLIAGWLPNSVTRSPVVGVHAVDRWGFDISWSLVHGSPPGRQVDPRVWPGRSLIHLLCCQFSLLISFNVENANSKHLCLDSRWLLHIVTPWKIHCGSTMWGEKQFHSHSQSLQDPGGWSGEKPEKPYGPNRPYGQLRVTRPSFQDLPRSSKIFQDLPSLLPQRTWKWLARYSTIPKTICHPTAGVWGQLPLLLSSHPGTEFDSQNKSLGRSGTLNWRWQFLKLYRFPNDFPRKTWDLRLPGWIWKVFVSLFEPPFFFSFRPYLATCCHLARVEAQTVSTLCWMEV